MLLLLSELVDLSKVVLLTTPAEGKGWKERAVFNHEKSSFLAIQHTNMKEVYLGLFSLSFRSLRQAALSASMNSGIPLTATWRCHDWNTPNQRQTGWYVKSLEQLIPMWWLFQAVEHQDPRSRWDKTRCQAAQEWYALALSRLTCSCPPAKVSKICLNWFLFGLHVKVWHYTDPDHPPRTLATRVFSWWGDASHCAGFWVNLQSKLVYERLKQL